MTCELCALQPAIVPISLSLLDFIYAVQGCKAVYFDGNGNFIRIRIAEIKRIEIGNTFYYFINSLYLNNN